MSIGGTWGLVQFILSLAIDGKVYGPLDFIESVIITSQLLLTIMNVCIYFVSPLIRPFTDIFVTVGLSIKAIFENILSIPSGLLSLVIYPFSLLFGGLVYLGDEI